MTAPRDEFGDPIPTHDVTDEWDLREGDRASTHPRSRLTRSPKTSGGMRPVWADEWAEVGR